MDSRRRLTNIVGGSAGNLVEWFDWYVYAAFALYFAPSFFPEGDQTARELIARRTYRMYRDVLDAKLPREEPRLSAREIDQFQERVEQFQRQNLVSPWPHRTTTLGDNFNVIWADLHRVLEL